MPSYEVIFPADGPVINTMLYPGRHAIYLILGRDDLCVKFT